LSLLKLKADVTILAKIGFTHHSSIADDSIGRHSQVKLLPSQC
jgi:hypothetical protein